MKQLCSVWSALDTELQLPPVPYSFVLICVPHEPGRYQVTLLLLPGVSFEQCYQPTPWNKVILEKLIAARLIKKLFAFYATQRFITFSQQPAIAPSRKIDESSTPSHPIVLRSFLILSSINT
jgi:hypothetical protein